jgi:enamine deaminase RidA (YjgF/YER057c/UK114 family)
MLSREDHAEERHETTRFLKTAIRAPLVLKEVCLDDLSPDAHLSSTPRGTRVDIGRISILLISSMADGGDNGPHTPDTPDTPVCEFRKQTRRTLSMISALLAAEGATWRDVVSTTWYLRDIAQSYSALNEERNAFYRGQALYPIPASIETQAVLSRPDLLVELEVVAILKAFGAVN